MVLRAQAKTAGVSSALIKLREAAGLSVRQIASAIEMPFATYYHYERRYEKDHLPSELVERLTPVLEKFGVDPAHVRALGRPDDELQDRAALRSEIVKLPRARLSPAAKALVSKQLADWQEERDYDQRQRLIERFEMTARGIATTLALDNQCIDRLPDLLNEAEFAVSRALDGYDEASSEAFESFVERNIADSVTHAIRSWQGYLGRQDPHKWERTFFSSTRVYFGTSAVRDAARAPQQYGERPIPLYVLQGLGGGPYELGALKTWCRRPPGLTGPINVYGLSVTGHWLEPWFFHGDIILLTPVTDPIPYGTLVMIAVGNEDLKSGLELVLGRERVSDATGVGIVTLGKEPQERGFRLTDAVVHRILRVKDLV